MSNQDWVAAEQMNALLVAVSDLKRLPTPQVVPVVSAKYARVYCAEPVMIPSATVWTRLAFTHVHYDTGDWFNPATPDLLIVPVTGLVRISGHVHFAAAAGGDRRLAIQMDTYVLDFDIRPGDAARDVPLRVGAEIFAYAGQAIKLLINQNSGNPLGTRAYPWFSPELSLSVTP